MKLSLKTELFALNYVKTAGDLTLAAEAMNIKTSTAKRYLRREEVQNYISDLSKDIEQVCKINKAKIVQSHLDIHERALEADSFAPANKALESVSALMGYNASTKVDVNLIPTLTYEVVQLKEIIDVEEVHTIPNPSKSE